MAGKKGEKKKKGFKIEFVGEIIIAWPGREWRAVSDDPGSGVVGA